MLVAGAVPARVQAQARFQAADVTAIEGAPGLRVITIHDAARNRCYLAFVAEPAAAPAVAAESSDVTAAAAQRDRDLAALVHAYESDTSVYAGTITPNPLKYDVLTQTVQITFALTVIENLLAHLEARLDRSAGSAGGLAVMPDTCAVPDTRPAP